MKFWSVSHKKVLILRLQKTWNIVHESYGPLSSCLNVACVSFLKLKIKKKSYFCSIEKKSYCFGVTRLDKWLNLHYLFFLMWAIPWNLYVNQTHLELFPPDKEYSENQFWIKTKKSIIEGIKDKNAWSIKSSCKFRFLSCTSLDC